MFTPVAKGITHNIIDLKNAVMANIMHFREFEPGIHKKILG